MDRKTEYLQCLKVSIEANNRASELLVALGNQAPLTEINVWQEAKKERDALEQKLVDILTRPD